MVESGGVEVKTEVMGGVNPLRRQACEEREMERRYVRKIVSGYERVERNRGREKETTNRFKEGPAR